MAYRVAINGFGRIGRTVFKIAKFHPEIEVVAINDLADIKNLAYLLKYDSAYSTSTDEISSEEGQIIVNGEETKVLSEPDPEKLPWEDLGIDVVVESTGFFVDREGAEKHLRAGAKGVIISAPGKGDNPVPTSIIGVSPIDTTQSKIYSNASCTTNCISPVMAILESGFGIKKAMMTTVHAYTSTQNIQDGPHKDFRRGRAAAVNIVPTSTGAAKSTVEVIDSLKNKFDGIAMRVPVVTGSISDITVLVNRQVTVEEVNKYFEEVADKGIYMGVVKVSKEPLVSTDILGSTYSSIIDLEFTRVVGGDLVKIVAWYDNETGYSKRLIEQVIEMGKQIA